MKTLNFALTLVILMASNVSMAQVFRTVTPDGQVIYTDNANSAYQYNNDSSQMTILDSYQKIQPAQNPYISTSQPMTPLMGETLSVNVSSPTNNIQVTPTGFYHLNIVMPDKNMVYRRPNDIVVQVETSPALQAGDRFVYRINGKHIATTQAGEYKISSLDYMPEKYTLTVQIENGKGKIINEQSQEFHLLANNFATKQKRKAEAEEKAKKEAYDKLPWYKKISYNINIGVK